MLTPKTCKALGRTRRSDVRRETTEGLAWGAAVRRRGTANVCSPCTRACPATGAVCGEHSNAAQKGQLRHCETNQVCRPRQAAHEDMRRARIECGEVDRLWRESEMLHMSPNERLQHTGTSHVASRVSETRGARKQCV